MAKRFVDTEIWNKCWYQELTLKEKLLVKYIFENCDCAGVWDINLRMVSFIIGETITLTDIYEINNKKELYDIVEDEYQHAKKVIVKDFITFQYGKLSYNCKPHLPIIKLLQKHGIDFETIDENNLTIKQQRKRLTATAKEKIFIRDKYECQYCGSREELEIDHIIPLSKGGNNEDDNLITACHKCNNLKGDKSLKEFINSGSCKNLDRVSKILDTLEEKEKEKEIEEEKEINTDPFNSKSKSIFLQEHQKVFGKKCYLGREQLIRLNEIAREHDLLEVLPIALQRLKKIYFKEIDYKPDATWLLRDSNFEKVMNGVYGEVADKKTQEKQEEQERKERAKQELWELNPELAKRLEEIEKCHNT